MRIEVPEGTIPEGHPLQMELSMCLYGPFMFPDDLYPVSPILILCPQTDIKLSWSIKVTLPLIVREAKNKNAIIITWSNTYAYCKLHTIIYYHELSNLHKGSPSFHKSSSPAHRRSSNKMTFVKAVCSQESPPHTFKKLDGHEIFSSQSSHAWLNGFSGYEITSKGQVNRFLFDNETVLALIVVSILQVKAALTPDNFSKPSPNCGCYKVM